MQRIAPVARPDLEGLPKEIANWSDVLLGRTSNCMSVVAAHSPLLARWFLGFIAAVRQPTLGATTDVRIRNLVGIKTSLVNQCEYCTSHSSLYGVALGLTEAELTALEGDAYKSSPLFSEREKTALTWAEAMTRNTAQRDVALWGSMRELFTPTEIIEISLNICLFNMVNRLNDSLWMEIEPEEVNRRQGTALKVSIEQLEEFASTFAKTGSEERARRSTIQNGNLSETKNRAARA